MSSFLYEPCDCMCFYITVQYFLMILIFSLYFFFFQGQLDTDVPASSALFATEFSQIVSKSTSNLRDDTNDSSSFPGENSSHNMTYVHLLKKWATENPLDGSIIAYIPIP